MTYSTQLSNELISAYRAWSQSLVKSSNKIYQTKLFLIFANLCDKECKPISSVVDQIK